MRSTVSGYSAGTISVTITPINGSNCNVEQVANALASAADNANAVAAVASFGSPVVAHNAAWNYIAGTPVWDRVGSPVAQSAEPTKATTANSFSPMLDLVGKTVTSPYANRENFLSCAVTITASTSATTCTGMGAQGANVKIYVTDLCVTRNDAGTTADVFTLNDSATTIIDLPNNGGGGGACKSYSVPLVVAANTAFQGTSGTSLTSVHMSATGFKGY
jgi:hypothetical protein